MAQTAQAASAQPEADADIGSASGRLKNRGRSAWRWAALALLVACAFLIRIWGVTKMHFWDENVYLLNAEYFYGGHAGYLEIDSRPPLLSLLFAAAFHAWHSDYAAEIVAMLLNALGPLFLFLAGCRIVGRNAAAIAALLLAFVPFFIGIFTADGGGAAVNSNGHSLRTDCPALTLILLALWLGTRALAKQTDLRFAAFGFSMAMAVLMRFASLSSVGFLALLLLAADRRVRASCGCAGGFLLGMAPYLCWSRAQYGGFLYTFINGWWNFDGEAEPFDYFAGHLPLMISWLGMAGLALWFVRRSADVAEWRRSGKPEGSAMGAVFALRWELFLWLWAAGVFLFFSILSHKELRYGIPIAAPLLLLAGSGLSWVLLMPRKAVKLAGAGALAAAMMATFWPSLRHLSDSFVDHSVSDEMVVAKYLRGSLPTTTMIYANTNYPDFAYYSGLTVNALPASGDELYASLKQLPAGGVLIAYKPAGAGGPPAQPPIGYLDSNPRFARIGEFPTVLLYRIKGEPAH